MAAVLNLVKADSESWGFRLTGGAEYEVPLTVVKVTENSIAEKSGLQVNDVIVGVNDTATDGLTHVESHDVIISGGNCLNLAIRRDLPPLISPSACDDEINEEVSNIMQVVEHERQVHYEMINPEEELQEFEQALSEEATEQQVVLTSPTRKSEEQVQKPTNQNQAEERKWSTFLQKPKNPKPAIKSDVPKAAPYRVVITKQKKKVAGNSPKVENEELEISDKCEESETVFAAQSNDESEVELEVIEDVTVTADITEEGEIIVDEEASEDATEVRLRNEQNAAAERLIEEKLAEVQKQLEVLSKLPSTIQSTIDAVTKQIASLVHIKTTTTETEEVIISTASSDSSNHADQGSEILDNELIGEKDDDDDDFQNLDAEDDNKVLEEDEEIEEVSEENNAEEEQEPEEAVTEEEEEARRAHEELLEKQKKEREQLEEFKQRRLKQKPTLPLKPIERPIVLPGGRRWSQPDDACPSIRNPKMSDEKIADTIETYSEVILGHTKGLTTGTKPGPGPIKKRQFTESNCSMVTSKAIATKNINFLKYQPPPKNLDYLQRSDVYKLVHDMEPPVRGISSRASKILAEQDYYQAG